MLSLFNCQGTRHCDFDLLDRGSQWRTKNQALQMMPRKHSERLDKTYVKWYNKSTTKQAFSQSQSDVRSIWLMEHIRIAVPMCSVGVLF